MKLNNDELIDFIYRYQKDPQGCAHEFEYWFDKIKPYLKLKMYRDPHGVLEYSDFENLARMGFWKAIRLYKRERSEHPLIWIYQLVKQRIVRSLKENERHCRGVLNSVLSPEMDLDNLEDILCDDRPIAVTQLFVSDVKKLHFDIFIVDDKAGKTFQLKLAFPNISRNSIKTLLGFKRRNGVAKLVKIIRKVSEHKMDKEVLNSIFDRE